MKALTLTQPWATLVALGAKRVETRSWRTNYRGPVAIHAAKSTASIGGAIGLHALVSREPFRRYVYDITLPRGSVVAVCELVDVVSTDERGGTGAWLKHVGAGLEEGSEKWRAVIRDEHGFGNYGRGRYAWLLADVRPLDPPMPWPGRQGLWNLPDGVLEEWERQA